MMIMPSNNTSGIVHYLAGVYPGSVGLLLSPDGWREPPPYMPYALDNGGYKGFNPSAFRSLLKRAWRLDHKPIWVAAPDVLGDAEATLKLWHEWFGELLSYDFPLAFVCQDGMRREMLPRGTVDCCFIGGTTNWKLRNAEKFKGARPLLHIGRVNTWRRLEWANAIGADSVDGTGFFRGDRLQKQSLINYVKGKRQGVLCSILSGT